MTTLLIPVAAATTALALVAWALVTLRGVWHALPRSNADFDLAGLRWSDARSRSRNPASAFYGQALGPRVLGALLRRIDRIAPTWGTRGALELFFTPLPWKLAAYSRLSPTSRPYAWSCRCPASTRAALPMAQSAQI